MEERKTIFDYIGQILQVYGFCILFLNVFVVLFGSDAEGYSSMFAFGNKGLDVSTMLEFLLASVCTVALRFLFFTDRFIKNMAVAVRTICMVISEILVISAFIRLFGWFPVGEWMPWLFFLLSFGICFVISVAVTILRERLENRRMQEALERFKAQEKTDSEAETETER